MTLLVKMGEVALPAVRCGAPKEPSASRAVGQCLLAGGAGTVPPPVSRARPGKRHPLMALANHLNAHAAWLAACPAENNCWKYFDLYEHSQPVLPFLEKL